MNTNPQRRLAAEFDQGQVPSIACVNRATTDLGVDWEQLIAAFDEYANAIFARVWGTPANIINADGSSNIPSGCWGILFLDDADAADALGYHDLTPEGLPLSKVFVRTTLNDAQKVSVTAARELAEMLVDPGIQMGAIGPDGQTWYAYEVADAVEREEFEVRGVAVSNFVYPAWFEAFRAPGSAQFDHLRTCNRPFELRPGGYMPVFRNGTWTQIFGDRQAAQRFNAASHPRMRARPHRMRLNQILEAQLQLRDLGFYRGRVDGMDGPQTRQALNDYLRKYSGPHDHVRTPGLEAMVWGKFIGDDPNNLRRLIGDGSDFFRDGQPRSDEQPTPVRRVGGPEAAVIGETTVTLDPDIRLQSLKGTRIVFSVSVAEASETAPLSGENFSVKAPANWSEIPVDMQIACKYVIFDKSAGRVFVRRGRRAGTCVFSGILFDPDSDPEVATNAPRLMSETTGLPPKLEVIVFFGVDGRSCGTMRKQFVLAQAVGSDVAPPLAPTDVENLPPTVSIGATVPDFTVEIHVDAVDQKLQFWKLWSPHFPEGWGDDLLFHVKDAPDYSELNALWSMHYDKMKPGDLQATLAEFGRKVFQRMPPNFQQAYWWLREKKGAFTIQILTNLQVIPFEIMVPNGLFKERAGMLMLEHPMARWLPNAIAGEPARMIERGEVATIAPMYPPPEGRPIAQRETVVALGRQYKGGDGGTTSVDFKDLMQRSSEVAVVHFFGHGESDAPRVLSRLETDDGWLYDTTIRSMDVPLGRSCRSFVILNACSSGAEAIVLGTEIGWPSTMMRKKFGAVLAPWWPIDPKKAVTATEELLGTVEDGKTPISVALMRLRNREDLWSASLAYVLYGDVGGKITLL
jgi:peptidoglycan hydrolase-like protein with peptidoglycan-binding domain